RRSSQRPLTSSSQLTASPSGSGVSRYRVSRPERRASTRPASPSAARCFVTACRVTGSSAASSVAVASPRAASVSTTKRRVGSASAEKTSDESATERLQLERRPEVRRRLAHDEHGAVFGVRELDLEQPVVVPAQREPPLLL